MMPQQGDNPVNQVLCDVADVERMAPGQIEKLRELVAFAEEIGLRVQALRALSRLAKPSEHRVLDTVLDALRSPEKEIQQAAGQALLSWGSRAVPRMLEALRAASDDLPFQAGLIVLLGRMGPEAAAARPLLVHLLRHPKLGPIAAQTLPKLQPGLLDLLAWLARLVLDWSITASVLTAALLIVLELSRSFMFDWLPLGQKIGQRRQVAIAVVLCGLAGGVVVVQLSRYFLRGSDPNRKRWCDEAAPMWALASLTMLAALVGVLIYRLETLPRL
jgi:hypothetical protein